MVGTGIDASVPRTTGLRGLTSGATISVPAFPRTRAAFTAVRAAIGAVFIAVFDTVGTTAIAIDAGVAGRYTAFVIGIRASCNGRTGAAVDPCLRFAASNAFRCAFTVAAISIDAIGTRAIAGEHARLGFADAFAVVTVQHYTVASATRAFAIANFAIAAFRTGR